MHKNETYAVEPVTCSTIGFSWSPLFFFFFEKVQAVLVLSEGLRKGNPGVGRRKPNGLSLEWGRILNYYIDEFSTVASEMLFIWIMIWISPPWIEERSCHIRYLFLLLPILLIEYLYEMLCGQPEPFVCVSDDSQFLLFLFNVQRGWGFQEFSWIKAGNINQTYNVVRLSPLYLSYHLLWVPSLWLVTFFSVRQIHHFGYLADLRFEGRLNCLLLIREGHKAFSDLVVWCICFWRQPAVPP